MIRMNGSYRQMYLAVKVDPVSVFSKKDVPLFVPAWRTLLELWCHAAVHQSEFWNFTFTCHYFFDKSVWSSLAQSAYVSFWRKFQICEMSWTTTMALLGKLYAFVSIYLASLNCHSTAGHLFCAQKPSSTQVMKQVVTFSPPSHLLPFKKKNRFCDLESVICAENMMYDFCFSLIVPTQC